jgi:hypothetical protein
VFPSAVTPARVPKRTPNLERSLQAADTFPNMDATAASRPAPLLGPSDVAGDFAAPSTAIYDKQLAWKLHGQRKVRLLRPGSTPRLVHVLEGMGGSEPNGAEFLLLLAEPRG